MFYVKRHYSEQHYVARGRAYNNTESALVYFVVGFKFHRYIFLILLNLNVFSFGAVEQSSKASILNSRKRRVNIPKDYIFCEICNNSFQNPFGKFSLRFP